MKRALIAMAVGALAIIVIVVWRRPWSAPDSATTPGLSSSSSASRTRADPRTMSRASLAGTVITTTGTAVAGARICAIGVANDLDPALFEAPSCENTDANGSYLIAELLPAQYVVVASAPELRPGVHDLVSVSASERRTGVDFQLVGGAVLLTGVVSDVLGGPITGARVHVTPSSSGVDSAALARVIVETDARGGFTVWTAPGWVSITATAVGYAAGDARGSAPGRYEVLLTPESALAGKVVDMAGAAVAGARVLVADEERWTKATVMTAEDGTFRARGLTPGRYVATVHADHGYGQSSGSVRLGVGETRDDLVVTVHPAFHVSATIAVAETKRPCAMPWAALSEQISFQSINAVHGSDGVMRFAGVRPGTYDVVVGCMNHANKEHYDDVVVADRDVTGLVWEVSTGATLRGRVLDADHRPVEGAHLQSRGAIRTGAVMNYPAGVTKPNGELELSGFEPGVYFIEVATPRGTSPADGFRVEIAESSITRDFVLEAVGAIAGRVVDEAGAPLANVNLRVALTAGPTASARTGDDGAFMIEGLRPGPYWVLAERTYGHPLRRANEDTAEQFITVTARETAHLDFVVAIESEAITGRVYDAKGAPVGDVYVVAVRNRAGEGSRGWSRWFEDRPTLTDGNGSFSLTSLAAGRYTVRAYRKGGDEVFVEDVAAGTRDLAITLTPAGSIAGRVTTSGALPDRLRVRVSELTTYYSRDEQFFRTQGVFVIEDLPPGRYRVQAVTDGADALVELDLAAGERKAGVMLPLAALATITGRVVDRITRQPVAGVSLSVETRGARRSNNNNAGAVTGADGRFALRNVAPGSVFISGYGNDQSMVGLQRKLEGTGTVDVGDLELYRSGLANGEEPGESGITLQTPPEDALPEDWKAEVAAIAPGSSAAKAGILVGDVIVTVDGLPVRGNVMAALPLLMSPAGTTFSLGLARGATVVVTLAPTRR